MGEWVGGLSYSPMALHAHVASLPRTMLMWHPSHVPCSCGIPPTYPLPHNHIPRATQSPPPRPMTTTYPLPHNVQQAPQLP